MRLGDRTRTATVAALGAGLLACAMAVHGLGSLRIQNAPYVAIQGAMVAICGSAAFLLWRRARRIDVVVVLAVALAARLVLVADAPTLSDDAYRFVWDGRVQAHGINPYDFAPADRRLTTLRDLAVFTRVNRPYVHTLYPPGNEIAYVAVNAGLGDGISRLKVAFLALEAVAVALLLAMLSRANVSAGRVALYAWHPLAVVEIAASAQPEALLLVPTLLALLLWERGWRARAGVALGIAALTKFVPILLAPFMLRRLGARFAAALAATVALLYLPYLGAGHRVIGSIGAFTEERFGSGPYNWLLDGGLGRPVAALLLAVALASLVVVTALRPPRDLATAAARAALLMGAALLAAHDVQPWYLLWVLPLLCLAPAPWLLWLCATMPVYYLTFGVSKTLSGDVARLIVWVPALALAVAEAIRWWSRRRSGAGAGAPAGAPGPAGAPAGAVEPAGSPQPLAP
jgi:hypothetical protein